MASIGSPGENLKIHPLTAELRRLGITDNQLESVHFSPNNRGFDFEQWSFRFPEGIPAEARNLIKPYCALKWLILEDPPPSRDRDDAWRLVSDTIAAPIFALGLKHKDAQRARARKPRGKIIGDGRTIGEIIKILAVDPEHDALKAEELWPHFYSALTTAGLELKEIEDKADFKKSVYEYETDRGPRQITFGTFANTVSRHRKALKHSKSH